MVSSETKQTGRKAPVSEQMQHQRASARWRSGLVRRYEDRVKRETAMLLVILAIGVVVVVLGLS